MTNGTRSLKRLSSFLITAIALSGTVSADARQQYPIHFVQAFKLAQERRIDADNKLLANMDSICDWLMYYRLKNGHLPEPGTEEDDCMEKLQKLIKPNPYSETGVQTKADQKPCKIRFQWDSM